MKKQPALSILVISGMLVLSFQNCGKQMNFSGAGAPSADKGASVSTMGGDPGQPLDPGDNGAPGSVHPTPPPGSTVARPTPPPHHEECDDDGDGHSHQFLCVTGVDDDLKDVSMLDMSKDDLSVSNRKYLAPIEFSGKNVSLSNVRDFVSLNLKYAVNASVSNIRSPMMSINANSVDLSNLSSEESFLLQVRAAHLSTASNIHSDVSAFAAHVIDSVSNVHSDDSCMSGDSIGSVSNIQASRMKIQGRRASALAVGQSFSNIHADFLSVSAISISSMSNIHSDVFVVRGSKIANISDVSGDIVLIDSHIDHASNVHGKIVLKGNSSVTDAGGATVVH